MLIPSDWNSIFSKIFYDKNIDILSREDSYDAEGGLITNTGVMSTFKGNVQFNNLKAVQEGLGLLYKIDMTITTQNTVTVDINSILKYQNIKYLVTDVIPFDTHKMVVCKIWKSQ